jgi:hypothetical protein
MKKYDDMTQFVGDFHSEEQCYAHLCKMKWGSGFECRKCQHTASVYGRTWYYRRCQKCFYDESCTAHTLFHKIKFPIVKAFWIVYQLSTMKKGMSCLEIARQYHIDKTTAWYFKRKVQEAMQCSNMPLLQGFVQVDETAIGGYEKGVPGRSHGKKKMVMVAVELDERKGKLIMKRARARVIENYSADEMKTAVDQMIDQQATIHSDQWASYPKAVDGRTHIAEKSDKGSNFPLLHRLIFNIKNWLRGIHHSVSAEHLQNYLDEFCYRFNRRNHIGTCPLRLLKRFSNHSWFPYRHAVAK